MVLQLLAAAFSQGFVNFSSVEFCFACPFHYVALFCGFSPVSLSWGVFSCSQVRAGVSEHLLKGGLDLVFPGRMPGSCMTAEPTNGVGQLPEG